MSRTARPNASDDIAARLGGRYPFLKPEVACRDLWLLAIPMAAVLVVLLLADYESDAANRNVRRIRLTVVAVLLVLVVVVLVTFATEGFPFY